MKKSIDCFRRAGLVVLALFAALLVQAKAVSAGSVCAEVQIEVQQEVTMERQAFDAHMRINNGLTGSPLEKVKVEVNFTDENGVTVLASSDANDTNPNLKFFIRLDTLSNIANVDGLATSTVAPATTADIHWLIIPVPGAASAKPAGTLYYVGATLTYTMGGVEQVVKVTPDYIFVKPMPQLSLDYFLPNQVWGDDPMTQAIEPVIPFSLGVRVKNDGLGTAWKTKIDSAQPKIVENVRGLLVDFLIEGSEVNGQSATPSLLVDLGNIVPASSATARWIMTSSLTGRFVAFSAYFSHADSLGGAMTSLIKKVSTHFLTRDVLADQPGDDAIRDFLAQDNLGLDSYRLYESDSVDNEVAFFSAASAGVSLTAVGGSTMQYKLQAPSQPGFVYLKLSDPRGGASLIKSIIRSDGKLIKVENGWLSKERPDGDTPWTHYFNLFDVNPTGSYTVIFENPNDAPQPPELAVIPDQLVEEGRTLTFAVQATDPNGTVPAVSALALPVGAAFADKGDGHGDFTWATVKGQAGVYQVTFKASDGTLSANGKAVIRVHPVGDTDLDGMNDAWELAHFGSLARDGKGDFDRDGISDLDEFRAGTDPAEVLNEAPAVVTNLQPTDEAGALRPELRFTNSIDPDNDPLTYNIQVFSGPTFDLANELVTSITGLAGQSATTGWTIDLDLNDNSRYWWRVQANDGQAVSEWASAVFLVNPVNDQPSRPQVSGPTDLSEVATYAPLLAVTNSSDPDGDGLTYLFTVFGSDGQTVLSESQPLPPGANGTTSWSVASNLLDNTSYVWQVTVTDEHGLSNASEPATFFVNLANDAPTAPTVSAPAVGGEVQDYALTLLVENGSDFDRDALTYYFELDKVNTFDSPDLQVSPGLAEGLGQTGWEVSGLLENNGYFWRVRVNDGATDSAWATGSFFVNQFNESPTTTPALVNPADGAWLADLTPLLQLGEVSDPDHDGLTYEFAVYADSSLTQLVSSGSGSSNNWLVAAPLADNHRYYWRARVVDEHGLATEWMAAASFFTDANGIDDTPTITLREPATDQVTKAGTVALAWDDSDADSSALIDLYYTTDLQGHGATRIAGGLGEDGDGPGDALAWDISALPEGTYYLLALIDDGNSHSSTYAPGSVTIDRTAPLVTAAPAGGTYELAQNVTLGAAENCRIYYSLDPAATPAQFVLYQGPLAIGQSAMTLRYWAVDAAGNTSSVLSEEYQISDTDGDSLPDNWEQAAFGSLDRDGNGDVDGDGLSDLREYQSGTDPNLVDSDADSLPDGWEVGYGLNPLVIDAGMDLDGDGFSNLAEYSVQSDPSNFASTPRPPTANGGADRVVNEQTLVTLDGSGSADQDDAIVAYSWQQTGGVAVALHNAASVRADFVAPDVGKDGALLTFALTVTDTLGLTATDTVQVVVNWVNQTPVAQAGADQVVNEGVTVTLDGAASSDVDQNIASYLWRQTGGTPVVLSDPAAVRPSFASPDVGVGGGVLSFELTVTDDQNATSTDTVQVTVNWVNQVPVANAGADQVVNEGSVVTLNGVASHDVDDGIAGYQWRQVGGATVTLSDPSALTPSFTTPDVLPAGAVLIFELQVADYSGATATDTVQITVNWVNQPPVANAGADQVVDEGKIVTMEGAVSHDVDQNIASYLWRQTGGASVVLSDPAAVRPSFSTPNVGVAGDVLSFELTVTDDQNATSVDTVQVTVNWVNKAPVANAGEDQVVNEGSSVSLDGAASSDVDMNIASYLWRQTGGAPAVLNDPAAVQPSFSTPDVSVAGSLLTFELTVVDDQNATSVDTVQVTVNWVNQPPLANAGVDQVVDEGSSVSLDGAASSDVDMNIASYLWRQTGGAQVVLNDPAAVQPSFSTPDVGVAGSLLTFELTVADDQNATSVDTVQVTVNWVNKAPVANAGVDQVVNEGTVVTLDGSASLDVDDGIAGYQWRQVGGTMVTLSDPSALTPSFTTPDVLQAGAVLSFELQVTDKSGATATDTVQITVNWVNEAPVANAGIDQVVDEGAAVTLDGTASSDVDQNITSYLWRQTGGAPVVLSDPAAVQPSFATPDVGVGGDVLSFELTVNDDQNAAAVDTVQVTVNWVNQPPLANSGPDQVVDEGATVTLDASGSSDVDDGIIGYQWRQVGGVTVALSDPTAQKPGFTTPDVLQAGAILTFELLVTDQSGAVATDTVQVTVNWVNQPPVANAGADLLVDEGYFVTLDGSASTDADDGVFSYSWTQISGTPVELDDPTLAKPIFETPEVGSDGQILIFQLTVTDNNGLKSTDTCEVKVQWSIHSFALFGLHKLTIGDGVQVRGGDIGSAGVAVTTGHDEDDDGHGDHQQDPTLLIGKGFYSDDEVALFGDLVELGSNSSVCRVYANALTGRGNVRCGELPLPAQGLGFRLPIYPKPGFGTERVELKHDEEIALPAGSYSEISIGAKATLVMTGGIYHVRKLTIGNNAQLLFAAPSTLIVGDELLVGEKAKIAPQALSKVTARDIWVFVVGSGSVCEEGGEYDSEHLADRDDHDDSEDDTDHDGEHDNNDNHHADHDAGECGGKTVDDHDIGKENRRACNHQHSPVTSVDLGQQSSWSANLYVVDGDLTVRHDTVVRGALVADRIQIENDVEVAGENGF